MTYFLPSVHLSATLKSRLGRNQSKLSKDKRRGTARTIHQSISGLTERHTDMENIQTVSDVLARPESRLFNLRH